MNMPQAPDNQPDPRSWRSASTFDSATRRRAKTQSVEDFSVGGVNTARGGEKVLMLPTPGTWETPPPATTTPAPMKVLFLDEYTYPGHPGYMGAAALSPSGEESDAMKAPTPHSRGDLELRRTAHEKRAR